MNISIRNKLLLSFAVVALVMILVSFNTWYQINQTTSIQNRVLNLRQPTVLAGENLKSGINRSLAGLRGYMILGKDPAKASLFTNERALSWQEIDLAMVSLTKLSSQWSEKQDLAQLAQLKVLIEEFRVAQKEIEEVAHQATNIASTNILSTVAAPLASKVIDAITALINEESMLPATKERKELLKLFADSRGSFALGLANIRAYLLTGERVFLEKFSKTWQANSQRFSQINERQHQLSAIQHKHWQDYQTFRGEFAPLPEQMFTLRTKPDWNLANYWLSTKAAPRAQKISEILKNIQQSQSQLAQQDSQTLIDKMTLLTLVMIIGTIVTLMIAVIVSLTLSRSITVPINAAVTRAKEISNGVLTGQPLETRTKDEISQLISTQNEMTSSLRNIITKVGTVGTELSAAAVQLNKATEQTHKSVENQQRETEQVVVAMCQMGETVQEVAQNTSLASTSAQEAAVASNRGAGAVSETFDSIGALVQNINTATNSINKLGSDTEGVDGIVAVISSIADQTNLLALNAAIEAARAGEQGRGFAVVADEVRTLAARTQESTEEIRSVLELLKIGAADAVQMMGSSHELAQNCLDKADNASSYLKEISQTVSTIRDGNTQIAVASEQQNVATKEINQNIGNINDNVEVIFTLSRETASAASQTGSLAADMGRMIAQFEV